MPYINKSKSDSWSTPKKLYNELNKQFKFDDFDPCPLNENPEFDGTKIEWANNTFVNPPYSKLKSTKKIQAGLKKLILNVKRVNKQ